MPTSPASDNPLASHPATSPDDLSRLLPTAIAAGIAGVMTAVTSHRVTVAVIDWLSPGGVTGNDADDLFESIVIGLPVALLLGGLAGYAAGRVTYRRADDFMPLSPIQPEWYKPVEVGLSMLIASLGSIALSLIAISVSYAVCYWLQPPKPGGFLLNDDDSILAMSILLFGMPVGLLSFAVIGAVTQDWLKRNFTTETKNARH